MCHGVFNILDFNFIAAYNNSVIIRDYGCLTRFEIILSETAGYITLGFLFLGIGKDNVGIIIFD